MVVLLNTTENSSDGYKPLGPEKNFSGSWQLAERHCALIHVPASRRAPSQTAIARALRVSQASVSNALNGRRDQVATLTYERIWAYAHAIGYRAKGLTPEATPHRQPTAVGIVFGNEFEEWALPPGVAALQWSLGETFAAAGIACASLGSPSRFRAAVFDRWTAEGGGALGLVVLGDVPAAFVQRLKSRVERIVSIGAAPAGVRSVQPDDERAAFELLRHLRELGHVDLAWFGAGAHDARHATVSAVAAKLGLRLSADYSLATSATAAKAGAEAASALVSLRAIEGDAPTAVVCSDLAVARAARRELTRHGLAVPRELSVAALHAWHELPESVDLTCAGVAPGALATAAARLLFDQPVAALPAELHAGNSTAAASPHAVSVARHATHAPHAA